MSIGFPLHSFLPRRAARLWRRALPVGNLGGRVADRETEGG